MSDINSNPDPKCKDYTGQVFGRLMVVKRVAQRGEKTRYECTCACGKSVTVKGNSLVTGHTKSCGCLRDECTSRLSHGMAGTPEYESFRHMWSRTTNPKDKDYGMYKHRAPPQSWRNFSEFFSEVGLRPGPGYSIDRIRNAEPYGPGNVRWTTSIVQANNASKNVAIEYQGRTQNVSEWARELGIPVDRIYGRLRRGWEGARALSGHMCPSRQGGGLSCRIT